MFRRTCKFLRSPTQVYNELASRGTITKDASQLAALPLVETLYNSIEAYNNSSSTAKVPRQVELRPPNRLGITPSFFMRRDQENKVRRAANEVSAAAGANKDAIDPSIFHPLSNIKGLYLYGSVGCGKTMLMDLLYQEVSTTKKQRVHFHQFMLDVQRTMHKIKSTLNRTDLAQIDIFEEVAQRMLSDTELLCFDEVAVADVADAMIMKRLFTAFYKLGVVVVYTSNRNPEELYKGGLNRESFLPFIRLVQNRCVIYDMASGTDHRLSGADAKTYLAPFSPENDKRFDQLLLECSKGLPPKEVRLGVFGRDVVVPRAVMGATGGVCMFYFHEICAQALSTADFEVIAKTFHTVFIKGVPRFPYESNDSKNRFLLLIDTLYEFHSKLVIYAETEPLKLERTAAEEADLISASENLLGGDDNSGDKKNSGVSSAQRKSFARLSEYERETGKRLMDEGDGSFQMQRCVSRLMEMRTKEYLESPHKYEEIGLSTE